VFTVCNFKTGSLNLPVEAGRDNTVPQKGDLQAKTQTCNVQTLQQQRQLFDYDIWGLAI
jgi:hypothetical protein